MIGLLFRPRTIETDCTVEVSHTFESLHAHVELDGEPDILPGDKVRVHGRPLNPAYGEVATARRRATLVRATWPERMWIRLTGNLECLELLDVSFTDRRDPS